MASQRSPGTICIGLLGQPRAGKSTLLDTLLDNEHPAGRIKRTLRLECANAKIYKCSSSDVACYRSCSSIVDMAERQCDSPGHEVNQMSVWKHVSFVDCPGGNNYMGTMLAGIVMTDGVLVLSKPPVTFAYGPVSAILAAANAMGKSIVILQTHMGKDSANDIQFEEHLRQIRELTNAMGISREVPVLGVSVRDKTNNSIGELCQQIDNMPIPEQDVTSPALMIIADSFVPADAGNDDETILVTIHGRVMQGIISTNQEIEIRPGVVTQSDDGSAVCRPIILVVKEIGSNFEHAAMAGQIVALTAAPNITNVDQQIKSHIKGGLGGHKLGQVGSLPGVYIALKVKVALFDKMTNPFTEDLEEVGPIENGQEILLTVGTMSTYGKVRSITEDMTTMVVSGLTPPTCASKGEHIFISRKQVLVWNLIGHGQILQGRSIEVVEPI